MDKVLRELVWARCKGYCEKCGKPLLNDSYALHHRKLKSRGGKDKVENLVALHHTCHNTATDSIHLNPKKATESGFMVGSWQEPAECPITLSNGDEVILTKDGKYEHKGRQHDGW